MIIRVTRLTVRSVSRAHTPGPLANNSPALHAPAMTLQQE